MTINETSNDDLETGSAQLAQLALITIEGALDLEATPRIDAEFARARQEDTYRVALDLSRLQLIDTAAISSILRGIDAFHAAGTDLEVRYPSPMAFGLFELCSLMEVVGIEFALDPRGLAGATNDFRRIE